MITFNNLNIGFNTHRVLEGISGNIQAGQLVALIGENGAGKSTLLHTLAGMHPFEGDILFNTKPLHSFSKEQLASKRAVMMQS